MQRDPQDSSPVRLFGNPFLEALTVMSVPTFLALWAVLLPAILVVAVVTAPTLWAPLLFAGGIVAWTLTEYMLHRFVFHFEARSALVRRIVFIIHGNHHSSPNDPLRNLMPPIVSIPVGAAVWAVAYMALGAPGTWAFFGFMSGYVFYDLVHYACHQWPMKGRLARILKTHHMRHHHLKVEGNYAITGMFWDGVLSTKLKANRDRVQADHVA